MLDRPTDRETAGQQQRKGGGHEKLRIQTLGKIDPGGV